MKGEHDNVSMTIRFPKEVYCYLKAMAVKERRSMKQQILFLIEQEAETAKIEQEVEHGDNR